MSSSLRASLLALMVCSPALAAGDKPVPVNVDNFIRAESDLYFGRSVKAGALGRFRHTRQMTPIDKQGVVRMNRDTLYSSAVFDLDAGPVTITLPDVGKRFMSMQVINQDHYAIEVVYAPGRYTYNRQRAGTRYIATPVRTLADPQNAADLQAAHAAQDGIKVEQASRGVFEAPKWDLKSQAKVRKALESLAAAGGGFGLAFGTKEAVNPVRHLIGTAIGWGGNPPHAAVYQGAYPEANDGIIVHRLTVKDVPVDGFWSISVYNAKGYFEKNELDAYSLNNLTAKPNEDGSVSVQFGGCSPVTPNCLPIAKGWNYTVRLYRPRREILDGTWKFPMPRRQ
jgi:hypothetical protein